MGIIETGTVSGNLPSKETFVVHYPGYPSSISRDLETLGGIQGITTARESTSNKLELHFRPEDPYAHPAWGERRPCNGFLLKIYKEDVKRVPETQPVLATSGACPALCADIVARVSESYCFDGMVDYQHVIPIHADVAHQRKRKWMEVKPLAGNDDLMDMADEDVMMLLPQFFAPKDMPDNLVLKLPGTSGPKKKDEAPTQNLCEDDIGPVFAIDFSVKEIPKVLNWEDFIVPSSDQWQWQVAVSALFDERPVWTRDSIVQRLHDKGLKCTHHMLNRFLLRSAYYLSGGPFLRFWMLLPQFFAPKDMRDNLVLKLPGTSGPKKKEEAPTQNLCEDDIGPVFAIDFSVKEIPKVLNWEDFIVPSSDQWQWQVAVSALFDERPVWTRDSIVQRLLDKGLKCTHHMLNRFLLRSAYYFSGGPFLSFMSSTILFSTHQYKNVRKDHMSCICCSHLFLNLLEQKKKIQVGCS
ncbi:general transcription factor 3C polypeptide 5-like [Brassica napus]|uniref:general transcription factor 3C polypeptide 5-like n=1 Tax=Brassica napus TaxID=3708 RepID=UPI002078CD09|nr:general transcription factor 3C polypeptide 5-like [Brassica napus]